MMPEILKYRFIRDVAAGRAEVASRPVARISGKITDEELERETGGTGLRYSSTSKAEAPRRRLAVDAQTGRVLENA
jgi:uncharacterized membrane protein YkoI